MFQDERPIDIEIHDTDRQPEFTPAQFPSSTHSDEQIAHSPGLRLMKFDNINALKNLENGGSIQVALLPEENPETKKFETTPYAENDIKTMQTMLAKLNQNELNVEENVRSSNNSSESWAFKS